MAIKFLTNFSVVMIADQRGIFRSLLAGYDLSAFWHMLVDILGKIPNALHHIPKFYGSYYDKHIAIKA